MNPYFETSFEKLQLKSITKKTHFFKLKNQQERNEWVEVFKNRFQLNKDGSSTSGESIEAKEYLKGIENKDENDVHLWKGSEINQMKKNGAENEEISFEDNEKVSLTEWFPARSLTELSDWLNANLISFILDVRKEFSQIY